MLWEDYKESSQKRVNEYNAYGWDNFTKWMIYKESILFFLFMRQSNDLELN